MNLTSWLDLIGVLVVIVGIALAVALWSVPAALVVAGMCVLAASWLIDRRGGSQ